ncbi:MAG: bmrU [Thermoleophilia bacterium]|nr:bmrU [Thermoleophilia bacterium]
MPIVPEDPIERDPVLQAVAERRPILRVAAIDRQGFEWVARRQSRVLDWSMPRLTHMGDNGSLWAWTAVVLALLGGRRGRRAARAGLLSLALVSPIVNGPMKWLVRRPRPHIDVVPEVRRIRHTPRTTSFPSGHSASAWCFSLAASLEAPILAPVLIPMAMAVAYSRVYTGAHYPGDAIAGSIVGAAMGAWIGPEMSALGAYFDGFGEQVTDSWG